MRFNITQKTQRQVNDGEEPRENRRPMLMIGNVLDLMTQAVNAHSIGPFIDQMKRRSCCPFRKAGEEGKKY
jgi:uncharacterized protein YeeX (DUF496 family)